MRLATVTVLVHVGFCPISARARMGSIKSPMAAAMMPIRTGDNDVKSLGERVAHPATPPTIARSAAALAAPRPMLARIRRSGRGFERTVMTSCDTGQPYRGKEGGQTRQFAALDPRSTP